MALQKTLVSLGMWPEVASRVADDYNQTVAAGSALTVTADAHSDKTVLLDTAAGSTVTLPAATGTGVTYRFRVSVIATSNSHVIKVANATDVMRGIVLNTTFATGVSTLFGTVAASDTITLNRTTTGSVAVGEWFEVTDVAAGYFQVTGWVGSSGTAATPFSAGV